MAINVNKLDQTTYERHCRTIIEMTENKKNNVYIDDPKTHRVTVGVGFNLTNEKLVKNIFRR